MRTNFLLKLLPILGVLTQIVYSHDRFHNKLRSPSRNPNQIFNFQYGLQHQLYPQNYYKDLNYHRNNYNKRYRKRPKFPPRPRSAECCPCSKSETKGSDLEDAGRFPPITSKRPNKSKAPTTSNTPKKPNKPKPPKSFHTSKRPNKLTASKIPNAPKNPDQNPNLQNKKRNCRRHHHGQWSHHFQPLRGINHAHPGDEDCEHTHEGVMEIVDTSNCSRHINHLDTYLVSALPNSNNCPLMTYDEAMSFCSKRNLRAVTISTEDDSDSISEIFDIIGMVSGGFWTGGFIENPRKKIVVWGDEPDAIVSELWGPGQPNGPKSGPVSKVQFCVAVRQINRNEKIGRLFDLTCERKLSVVCERKPKNMPTLPTMPKIRPESLAQSIIDEFELETSDLEHEENHLPPITPKRPNIINAQKRSTLPKTPMLEEPEEPIMDTQAPSFVEKLQPADVSSRQGQSLDFNQGHTFSFEMPGPIDSPFFGQFNPRLFKRRGKFDRPFIGEFGQP